MTRHITSDPWCNAVMAQWNAATAAGDRGRQLMFVSLCAKHRAPSIDWRRVAEDAGIEVPDPITEDRALAFQDALAGLVNEASKIIEHSGSTEFIAAYNHARALLGRPEQPDNWISQADAHLLATRLAALTEQIDRLLAAGIETNPSILTAALRRRAASSRATSLEESSK